MSKQNARPSLGPRNPPPLRHRLHRFAGLASVIVLVHLVVTGLPLQLTAPLGLAERYVTSGFLLDHYGLDAPRRAVASGEAVLIGEQLYLGERAIGTAARLHGSVRVDAFAAVLIEDALVLVPADDSGIPERIAVAGVVPDAVGSQGDRVHVRTDAGVLALDDGWVNLVPSDASAQDIDWAVVAALEGETLTTYRTRYRNNLLSAERVLQDLHSGRILGTFGEWVVNVASLGFLVLAVSGLAIWWRSRPR